jgi:hypothetical protein
VIAIGCASSDERAFRAGAARTIAALDEGDSLLLRHHRRDVVEAYDQMLADAAERDGLEAVLLVHQDAVVEPHAHVVARIRGVLAATPEVAVVGVADGSAAREAATVGGTLLALSPWAVRNLRFDPALGGSVDACAHDLSLQARAAGRRVVAAPLGVARTVPDDPARRRGELSALVELRRKWRQDGVDAPW